MEHADILELNTVINMLRTEKEGLEKEKVSGGWGREACLE